MFGKHQHSKSMTNIPFRQVVDKRIDDIGLKMKINSILNFDERNIILHKENYVKHKQNLRSLEDKNKLRKPPKTFLHEEINFIKSYKKLEEFKNMRSRSTAELATFEETYH